MHSCATDSDAAGEVAYHYFLFASVSPPCVADHSGSDKLESSQCRSVELPGRKRTHSPLAERRRSLTYPVVVRERSGVAASTCHQYQQRMIGAEELAA